MKEYYASKELLLQTYEGHVRASLVATYFGRSAMLLIILFVTFVGNENKFVSYVVFGASILVTVGWFFEAWSSERGKQLIRRQIGRAEEGKYDVDWEDANLRIGYFMHQRFFHHWKRTFTAIEPIFWIYLVSTFIFVQDFFMA